MGKALIISIIAIVVVLVIIITTVAVLLFMPVVGSGGANGNSGGNKETSILSDTKEGAYATRTYAPVQLGQGVESQRTVSVDAGGGKSVSLVLTGLQPGMEAKERIPKSFADDVSKITFSRQPSQVLESDPLIVWRFDEIYQGESVNITYEVPSTLVGIDELLNHVGEQVAVFGNMTDITFMGGQAPVHGSDYYYALQEGFTITDYSGNSVYVYIGGFPPKEARPDIGDGVTARVMVSEVEGQPILITVTFVKGFSYDTMMGNDFEPPKLIG